jgi:hypothetical protein
MAGEAPAAEEADSAPESKPLGAPPAKPPTAPEVASLLSVIEQMVSDGRTAEARQVLEELISRATVLLGRLA